MNRNQKSSLIPRQLEHEIDNSPVCVSYIIATRNRSEYLKRTLTNVREFLGKEDELIIIDGGSTDGTAEVVQKNSDIVSVFVSEPDSSEGHAINKAIFLARGRFIKPITDDDYFYPDAMRRLVAEGEAHPEIDAIHTGGEAWAIVNGEPRFMHFRRLPSGMENPSQLDIFHAYSGLGLLVRRRTILKTGGISPGYGGVDGDWHCKLIEAGCRVRYLDVNLYRWTKYPHSGVTAEDELYFCQLRFAFRLGEWTSFYGYHPRFVARVTGIDKMPEGLAFQYAIYLTQCIWRSRARILLHPLPQLVKIVGRTGRALKRLVGWDWGHSKTDGRAKNADVSAPFTGKLL